jgi:hypothetical protein
MPTITTSDGVRLNHLEGGDPSDRAVVLIAGFRAPATSWYLQLVAQPDRPFPWPRCLTGK